VIAERTCCRSTAIALVLAIAGTMIGAAAIAVEQPLERLVVDAPRTDFVTAEIASDPIICRRHQSPRSKDTLFVVLRDEPEWTGIDEESDWSKSYHMVWDGPIRTWTTMRTVRVPSLDHRMIESIEPVGTEHHAVYVHVRVVVPGDLEAALEWVRARPEVESASVRLEYPRLDQTALSGTIGDAR
jgi:hypothetical protein